MKKVINIAVATYFWQKTLQNLNWQAIQAVLRQILTGSSVRILSPIQKVSLSLRISNPH